MKITRRFLLGGILAATVTAIAPKRLPTIFGDGVNDDAEGLNAFLRGDPFAIANEGFTASEGLLSGGTFLLRRPIIIPGSPPFPIRIIGCHFVSDVLSKRKLKDEDFNVFIAATMFNLMEKHRP